jgi:1-deoxy-D-xylulose-5-phosphate synthase
LPAERAADLLQAEGISATVVNARFVKPLDKRLITSLAESTGAIVTVEENARAGGFGSAVLEVLEELVTPTPIRVLGVPDRVFEQASQGRLRELAGLTSSDIADAARAVLNQRSSLRSLSSVAGTNRVG